MSCNSQAQPEASLGKSSTVQAQQPDFMGEGGDREHQSSDCGCKLGNIGGMLTCESTSYKALCPVWLVLMAREPQKSFTVHVIRKEIDCLQQASVLCDSLNEPPKSDQVLHVSLVL